MLKGAMSGCEAAVQIHQNDSDAKIIFLTAYAEREMIDYAVDAHASAYLVKPYREEEILATMRLLFVNKEKPVIDEEKIPLKDGYIFNTKLHRLFKGNKEVQLGKKPLKLIEILALNKNVSVSNAQICTFIWGENKNDKTLRSLIHRIRTTIHQDIIQNINGLGYKIA
jgi:DNA-binding response OmpR family regulator